jgi:hypothetical protein
MEDALRLPRARFGAGPNCEGRPCDCGAAQACCVAWWEALVLHPWAIYCAQRQSLRGAAAGRVIGVLRCALSTLQAFIFAIKFSLHLEARLVSPRQAWHSSLPVVSEDGSSSSNEKGGGPARLHRGGEADHRYLLWVKEASILPVVVEVQAQRKTRLNSRHL